MDNESGVFSSFWHHVWDWAWTLIVALALYVRSWVVKTARVEEVEALKVKHDHLEEEIEKLRQEGAENHEKLHKRINDTRKEVMEHVTSQTQLILQAVNGRKQ